MSIQLHTGLTTWFCLHAVSIYFASVLYFFFPRLFFEPIGGPFGKDVTPNLIWVVRTQASYFAISAGCMVVGARSHDPTTRRAIALALTAPGLFWQIPSAVMRATQEGGSLKVMLVSIAIILFVSVPYWYFCFIDPESTNMIDTAHSVYTTESGEASLKPSPDLQKTKDT